MRDNRVNRDIAPIDNTSPLPPGRPDLDIPWWSIYAIHAKGDPENIWYVGQSKALWQRIPQHEQNSRSQTHLPLYAHLSTHEWEYRVLELVDTKDEARTAERRWIRRFLSEGKELYNIQGRKPDTQSQALKAKRDSAAEKGLTLVEGALIAVRDREFSVYEWSEEHLDYLPTLTGVLDK